MLKHRSFMLFAVLLGEGFLVLSLEILALRLIMPAAGSSTQGISIVIACVLLSLAAGYFYGAVSSHDPKNIQNRRRKIIQNFAYAALFFVPATSLVFTLEFFDFLSDFGLKYGLSHVLFYSFLFLVPPVFLLGQTVPLISHYFYRWSLSFAAGVILFLSTLGSLIGALFPPLITMPLLGLPVTAITLNVVLVLMILILAKRKHIFYSSIAMSALLACVVINADFMLECYDIKASNHVNTVQIKSLGFGPSSSKILYLNGGAAGYIGHDTAHKSLNIASPNITYYVTYIESNFINPATHKLDKPLDILAIGAGGFILGAKDTTNNYVFVDVDPQLQDISEKFLHERKLGPNKRFIVQPARSYLRSSSQEFDLIFVDVFNGRIVPAHLVTYEFFKSLKKRLKPGGAVVMNIVTSPSFRTEFSRNVYATFSDVFWPNSRVILGFYDSMIGRGIEDENPQDQISNVLHVYFDTKSHDDFRIYTDSKNRAYLDIQ